MIYRNKIKNLSIIFGLVATCDIAIAETENILFLLVKNKDLHTQKIETPFHL